MPMPLPWTWYDGTFVKIDTITPTLKRFWVQIPSVETLDFVPGQFMTFDLPIHERRNKRWRSYSIASAPNGTNILEFVIVWLDGGLGTTYLFNEVKVGDKLRLRGALGKFTLPPTLPLDKEICFVCTGTGVAPFRSMLLDIKNRKLAHPPMRLIFGTRYANTVLYREELTQLAADMPNFSYHITLSRETADGCEKGYVHPIYERLYANNPNVVFYLCGWNVMLDEAKQRLKGMGFTRKQIKYESYG